MRIHLGLKGSISSCQHSGWSSRARCHHGCDSTLGSWRAPRSLTRQLGALPHGAHADVQQDYGSAWLGLACPLPFRSVQVWAKLRPPPFVAPQESAPASQPTAARCAAPACIFSMLWITSKFLSKSTVLSCFASLISAMSSSALWNPLPHLWPRANHRSVHSCRPHCRWSSRRPSRSNSLWLSSNKASSSP